MDFELIADQWQHLDKKLDQSLRLEVESLRLKVLRPVRWRLWGWSFWPCIDIVFCLALLLYAGSFLASHLAMGSLVVPALLLMTGAILLLGTSILQLVRLSELRWDGSVQSIQGSLERLRVLKIQQFKWIILLAPLVGFSGMLIVLQSILEQFAEPNGGSRNIIQILDAKWIVANYLFGLLFVSMGSWVARWSADRFEGKGWWSRWMNDVAGTTLRRSREELAKWESLDELPRFSRSSSTSAE